MSDRTDDCRALNRTGEQSIARAAKLWADAHRHVFDGAATAEECESRYQAALAARTKAMPAWCEYDADYEDFASACHSELELEEAEYQARRAIGAAD